MAVLEMCLSIRRERVSMPVKILKALVGLIEGPKSLIPSALALIVKAAGPNSSANDNP